MIHHWCRSAVVEGEIRDRVLIGVVDGRIESIELDMDPPSGARRHVGVTMPGFANAHSHAFHRALRGRAQACGGSFWTWREQMYQAAERLDPDRYHRLARATFAEMAMAGVTAVGEFHYLHHQRSGQPYEDPNAMGRALLAAAAEAGIRITLLDTIYVRGGIGHHGYLEVDDRQRRFSDHDVDRWIERAGALADAVTPAARIGAAVHSVRAVDPPSIRSVAEWTGEQGMTVHVHASEQTAENEQCLDLHHTTPIGVLADAGLLGPRCTVVHATNVDDVDIAALAASSAAVCACPTTERDLADGIGPTSEFERAGVPLALGSDSHAVVDMFEEVRGLEMHGRLTSGRRGVHGVGELLAAVTVAGHRSLGWGDAGEIRVGAHADLVTVALDSVRTAGGVGDVASVLFAANSADVVDVVVDGNEVVVDGRHVSIDVAAELDASIRELMDR